MLDYYVTFNSTKCTLVYTIKLIKLRIGLLLAILVESVEKGRLKLAK